MPKILIVDDPDFVEVTCMVLEKVNHRVIPQPAANERLYP